MSLNRWRAVSTAAGTTRGRGCRRRVWLWRLIARCCEDAGYIGPSLSDVFRHREGCVWLNGQRMGEPVVV